MRRSILILSAALIAGNGTGTAVAQSQADSLVYAVSALSPPEVTVPPILLQDGRIHALMVELASGSSMEEAGHRLGLDAEDRTRLAGLLEVEGLGRMEGGEWRPLALALDAAGADSLREHAGSLARAIAETLDSRWSEVDSLVGGLPVAGRLPLEQTGFVLLGDYLLGRMQAGLFWEAGLAPRGRPFAYRVYRLPPDRAPAGHSEGPPGPHGIRIVRFAPTPEPFGLDLLGDPEAPITRALIAGPGGGERLRAEVLEAYRVWYLFGTPPGAAARRLLVRSEAVDAEGRLRVPLITASDIEAMQSAAGRLADALWPPFQEQLGATAELAGRLGYGDPQLLGEVALWTWEMAANLAVHELIERGRILPPPSGRGQAVLIPLAGPEPR
ncbi:MAG: hypothetical protein R6W82_06685 [bacterium]